MAKPRVPVTATWEAGYMKRITALTRSNLWHVRENARLHRENVELQARLDAVREIFAPHYDRPFARRIVHIVDGDEDTERYVRGTADRDVGADAGGAGVGGPQPAGGGVAGRGPVPAGGGEPAERSGGGGAVPEHVGAVAVWPYEHPVGA